MPRQDPRSDFGGNERFGRVWADLTVEHEVPLEEGDRKCVMAPFELLSMCVTPTSLRFR